MAGTPNAQAMWANGDGLNVKFGNFQSNPGNFVNRPWALSTLGAIKQLEIEVDLTRIAAGTTWFTADANNDGTSDSFTEEDPYLPANSSVLRVTMVTTIAATGGTSFTLGTYTKAGATTSANSLVTATEGVTANFATVGFRTFGNGALVAATAGTAGVGTSNAFLGISTVGTFTAGTIRLIIEYIDNRLPDLVTNN